MPRGTPFWCAVTITSSSRRPTSPAGRASAARPRRPLSGSHPAYDFTIELGDFPVPDLKLVMFPGIKQIVDNIDREA